MKIGKHTLTENRVLIFGASIFIMWAGFTIMFEPEQFTSFEYTILYMVTAILFLMLVILDKVSKKRKR